MIIRIFILIVASVVMHQQGYAQVNNSKEKPSVEEIRKQVNLIHNPRAVNTFNQYERLLKLISKDKYISLPLHEFKDSINNQKVIIGLRHDVDCHPFKALIMAEMEKKYNLKATYFILATSGYYCKLQNKGIYLYKSMDKIYKEIFDLGHEIGIHNDLLAVLILHGIEPFSFNEFELKHYKEIGIDIHGTVAHGSQIASSTVPNFQIFSDFAKSKSILYNNVKYPIGLKSMAEYGFEYEAYFINHNKYYSDSGGTWNLKGGFEELLQKIEKSKPGDRIQILIHPVWWGK